MTATTTTDPALLDVLADPNIVECVEKLLELERRTLELNGQVDKLVRNDRVTNAIYAAGRERDDTFERLQMILRRRLLEIARAERKAAAE